MKKLLVGALVTTILIAGYIFPTSVNVNEYGMYIEAFNGNGYFLEF